MAALVRWDNSAGAGVLVRDADGRIVQGESLLAEIMASLHTDAPADPGDPAPVGVVRAGYWAASIDPDAIVGSKLWMVRYVRNAREACRFAESAAMDALQWMVDAKKLASVSASASNPRPRLIVLELVVVLANGIRRAFSLDLPYQT